MTADQLGKGRLQFTVSAVNPCIGEACLLVFFDWDEDGVFEHVAAQLLDGSWVWSSSSAGRVVHVNPAMEQVLCRQWREIEGALDGGRSTLRVVNWTTLHALR
jgi:hypothetical protein